MASSSEPIAVIGMACKLPQDAVDVETFWELLCQGKTTATDVPKERFNVEGFYHPDPKRLGSLASKRGHFLKGDLSEFDAHFFEISPPDADCMDPQQRLMLETTYHALENAGIPLGSIAKSSASVFVASTGSRDYGAILSRDLEPISMYHATGTGGNMLANRISHCFDLCGPSMTIDTACSSGLYALHQACQNLRSGESSLSIVGSCNIILSPDVFMIPLSNAGILSPDGVCFSFDQKANGYARGEGISVVVLKLLSTAIADGDVIRCIIRATGAGTGGRTPSITQPSFQAQVDLINEAYGNHCLEKALTGLVEAHGTGTPVGDPIEARAIIESFFKVEQGSTPRTNPLIVGAVKSNIGHSEAASGITSLIKTIKCLETGLIPPNAHFETLNPNVNVEGANLVFPKKITTWPSSGIRRASINNFGYGGANSHCVIDDVYHFTQGTSASSCLHATSAQPQTDFRGVEPVGFRLTKPPTTHDGLPSHSGYTSSVRNLLIVLSASDEQGIERVALALKRRLSDILQNFGDSSEYFQNIAFTLSERRSRLHWKSFVTCHDLDSLAYTLSGNLAKPIRSTSRKSIIFIFTGQGTQWARMGHELMSYHVYSSSIRAADEYLRSLGCRWSVSGELGKAQNPQLHTAALSQPLCTILQIALIDLLGSLNIHPQAVLGHSSGEIAAAFCAGAIDRQTAWKLAYFRGLVSEASSISGPPKGMMAVALAPEDCQKYIDSLSFKDTISIACYNSPHNTTLSGLEDDLLRLKAILDADNIFARQLAVRCAYHSQYMKPVSDDYFGAIQDISMGQLQNTTSKIRIFSSVTGSEVHPSTLADPNYWIRNLLQPVLFSQSARAMLQSIGADGESDILVAELGPSAALKRMIDEIITDMGFRNTLHYASCLRKGLDSAKSLIAFVGYLFQHNVDADIMALNQLDRATRVPLIDLPLYPFNHSQPHWFHSRLDKLFRARSERRHELLGIPEVDFNRLQPNWRNVIRARDTPWVLDHTVGGATIYPAAGYIAMAVEAMKQLCADLTSIKWYHLQNVRYLKPIQVNRSTTADGAECRLYLKVDPMTESAECPWYDFSIYGLSEDRWFEACSGRIQLAISTNSTFLYTRSMKNHVNIWNQCNEHVGHERFYSSLNQSGFQYGPTFQSLRSLSYNSRREATALINLHHWKSVLPEVHSEPYVIHPTALDAIFHLPIVGATQGGWKVVNPKVAHSTDELWISADLINQHHESVLRATSSIHSTGLRDEEYDMAVIDPISRTTLIIIRQHRATAMSMNSYEAHHVTAREKRLVFAPEWQPDYSLAPLNLGMKHVQNQWQRLENVPLESIQRADQLASHLIWQYLPEVGAVSSESNAQYLQDYYGRLRELTKPLGRLSQQTLESLLDRWSEVDPLTCCVASIGRKLGQASQCWYSCEFLSPEVLALERCSQYLFSASWQRAGKLIDTYAHVNPNLRILEIGAGNGDATAVILQQIIRSASSQEPIMRFKEYTYTDIESAYLDTAKERFALYSAAMAFKVLDISAESAQQGFEYASYDIVVASFVFHMMPDPLKSLENARRLLKPGGKLILIEPHSLNRASFQFVFGLSQPWRSSLNPLRKLKTKTKSMEWNELMLRAGFGGIDVESFDPPEKDFSFTSLMVSSVPRTPEQFEDEVSRKFIVIDPSNEIQAKAASDIKAYASNYFETEVVSLRESERREVHTSVFVVLLDCAGDFWSSMSERDFKKLQYIASNAQCIIWVNVGGGLKAENPRLAIVDGLSKSVCSERGYNCFIVLCLENFTHVAQHIDGIIRRLRDVSVNKLENIYAEKNGLLHVIRTLVDGNVNDAVFDANDCLLTVSQPANGGNVCPFTLTIGTPGLLNTLQFVETPALLESLADDEMLVQVKAASLNFKDILIALGRIPGAGLGADAAGVVLRAGPLAQYKPGDRILATSAGSYSTFANYIRCKSVEVEKIPDDMDFCKASSLPTVYCTAYMAIFDIARIRKGESILIHAAAGGVGQIAVQCAQLVGAEIYGTVGSDAKRDFLTREYNIPSDRLFSSRDLTFVDAVQKATSGRGVDVVLNSLPGEFLHESFKILAPFGRFVEIGRKDVLNNSKLDMSTFARSSMFMHLNLADAAAKPTIKTVMGNVLRLMENHSQLHEPRPLHILPASRVEEGFRLLQSGKMAGKVVFDFDTSEPVKITQSPSRRRLFKADASYVVAGGFGGLGRRILRWMIERGARHVLVLSRSGPEGNSGAKLIISEGEKKGAAIVSGACDLSDSQQLTSVICAYSKSHPPIKGCIHGGMLLKDDLFSRMSFETFSYPFPAKVAGTQNLHDTLPRNMDFFIMLSSVCGVFGMYGQANYAAANTFQDAMARHRVACGLPAMSINVGIVADAGIISENASTADGLNRLGYRAITVQQLLWVLGHYCDPSVSLSLREPEKSQITLGLTVPEDLKNKNIDIPGWMMRPSFGALHKLGQYGSASEQKKGNAEEEEDYRAVVAAAQTTAEAGAIVTRGARKKLERTMAIGENEIDLNRAFYNAGVDSLLATEIRHWFEKTCGVTVTVATILGGEKISSVCEEVARKMKAS